MSTDYQTIARTVLEMTKMSMSVPQGQLAAKIGADGIAAAQTARWIEPSIENPGWFNANQSASIRQTMRQVAEAADSENKEIGDVVLFVNAAGRTVQGTVSAVLPNGQLELSDDRGARITIPHNRTKVQAKAPKIDKAPTNTPSAAPSTAPQTTTPVSEEKKKEEKEEEDDGDEKDEDGEDVKPRRIWTIPVVP